MKTYFGYFLASLFGGLLVLLASINIQNSNNPVNSHKQEFHHAHHVNHMDHGVDTRPMVPNFVDAAAKATPSVVKIKSIMSEEAQRSQGRSIDPFEYLFGRQYGGNAEGELKIGAGSGVIISSDGYIVTNNHVVGQADVFDVVLYDKRIFKGQLIGKDKLSDLAVIKIEGNNLPAIEYGDSDEIKIGEWVLAVGNPFEILTSTVTAGIVSAKGRNINLNAGGIESYIQTDAAVNPGNSGGALVDNKGRLIGINTAISSETGVFAGYSFAIPVSLMDRVVGDLIQYGNFDRPMLGINIAEVEEIEGTSFSKQDVGKVYVYSLTEGGAAERSGLLPFDVILNVDGEEVNSIPELQEKISMYKVGDEVKLRVRRDNRIQDISIRLKKG